MTHLGFKVQPFHNLKYEFLVHHLDFYLHLHNQLKLDFTLNHLFDQVKSGPIHNNIAVYQIKRFTCINNILFNTLSLQPPIRVPPTWTITCINTCVKTMTHIKRCTQLTKALHYCIYSKYLKKFKSIHPPARCIYKRILSLFCKSYPITPPGKYE